MQQHPEITGNTSKKPSATYDNSHKIFQEVLQMVQDNSEWLNYKKIFLKLYKHLHNFLDPFQKWLMVLRSVYILKSWKQVSSQPETVCSIQSFILCYEKRWYLDVDFAIFSKNHCFS